MFYAHNKSCAILWEEASQFYWVDPLIFLIWTPFPSSETPTDQLSFSSGGAVICHFLHRAEEKKIHWFSLSALLWWCKPTSCWQPGYASCPWWQRKKKKTHHATLGTRGSLSSSPANTDCHWCSDQFVLVRGQGFTWTSSAKQCCHSEVSVCLRSCIKHMNVWKARSGLRRERQSPQRWGGSYLGLLAT